jgi:hypothetical protein
MKMAHMVIENEDDLWCNDEDIEFTHEPEAESQYEIPHSEFVAPIEPEADIKKVKRSKSQSKGKGEKNPKRSNSQSKGKGEKNPEIETKVKQCDIERKKPHMVAVAKPYALISDERILPNAEPGPVVYRIATKGGTTPNAGLSIHLICANELREIFQHGIHFTVDVIRNNKLRNYIIRNPPRGEYVGAYVKKLNEKVSDCSYRTICGAILLMGYSVFEDGIWIRDLPLTHIYLIETITTAQEQGVFFVTDKIEYGNINHVILSKVCVRKSSLPISDLIAIGNNAISAYKCTALYKKVYRKRKMIAFNTAMHNCSCDLLSPKTAATQ